MSIINKISQIRRDFTSNKLDESSIKKDPIEQFKIWFDDALQGNILDPNAMALSTATANARPSSRYVLLKNYDESGFVFYSNYESQKGIEIAENPQASLLFYWDKFERQIRIDGIAKKIPADEADEYFQTRSYSSRIGAWASRQSSPLGSRFALMRKVAGLMVKYPKNVPLPPFWGGYRLAPSRFEFWQGRESRLHDRFSYTKENGLWKIERLSP